MHFRPGDVPEGDEHPDGPIEWADNWLSNTFAWGAYHILPSWCQTPEHWTSKLTQYLFVDCPCCLLFRGIALGIALAYSVVTIGTAIAWLLL